MRLNHDFVRLLLATIQEVQWNGGYHDLYFEDWPDQVLSYYIQMLDDAGLIEAAEFSTQELMCWRAKWITDAGEQFLVAANNEERWERAKRIVHKSHRKRTVESLKQALEEAKKVNRKRCARKSRRRK
jgi:LPS O-antigen subunit length determinant protein (WzzB/FepE family)